MTHINHRRKNRKPVNQRHARGTYHNGYSHPDNKTEPPVIEVDMGEDGIKTIPNRTQRVGRTDYLDKSLHGWGRKSEFADKAVGAGIGNDFTNGHRGMARAVRGAKKFVRSRIRFHDKVAVHKLIAKREEEINE
jgi:hypothetical protein